MVSNYAVQSQTDIVCGPIIGSAHAACAWVTSREDDVIAIIGPRVFFIPDVTWKYFLIDKLGHRFLCVCRA